MQSFAPYISPPTWLVYDLAPLECVKQAADLRAVSDLDLRAVQRVDQEIQLSVYTERSHLPEFKATPLRHNIPESIRIFWYRVESSFLIPPRSGLVVSGTANEGDMRHRLVIRESDVERRPRRDFRGRHMYEFPVPAVDLSVSACLDIRNTSSSFVNVLCMRLTDVVASSPPCIGDAQGAQEEEEEVGQVQ